MRRGNCMSEIFGNSEQLPLMLKLLGELLDMGITEESSVIEVIARQLLQNRQQLSQTKTPSVIQLLLFTRHIAGQIGNYFHFGNNCHLRHILPEKYLCIQVVNRKAMCKICILLFPTRFIEAWL